MRSVVALNRDRVLERLQARRVLVPVRVTEIGVSRTAGDDQVVVVERWRRRPARPACRDVDARRLAEEHAYVPGAPQDPPDRRGNVARRQRRRRDLIQQWLKDVVIPSIQQRDLHVGVPQSLGGRQSAESAADDHNMGRASRTSERNTECSTWHSALCLD